MKCRTSRRHLCGQANTLWVLLLGTFAAVFVLVAALGLLSKKEKDTTETLMVYCAAGLRGAVAPVAEQYRAEYGIEIDLQYGGSQTLLGQLEANKNSTADLYIAGDGAYVELAKSKGLVEEIIPVATMRPVIAVERDNPKNIKGISDLLNEEIRTALGNPDQTAVGRLTRKGLRESGQWKKLAEMVTESGVYKPTVNEIATDIKIGAIDAGIIWDSTAAMPQYRDHIDIIEAPELAGQTSLVTLGVLKSSVAPTSALRFARYLTSKDRGLPVFAQNGFKPVDGDPWALNPEITFFCGAVNRRAVDEVIKEFEQREGVTVNTVYNGCGILTGQMKAINLDQGGAGFPDVYMACDRYYLDNVKEWFQEDADISDADIVIAVPKGNPKNIQSIDDLTKPGIRVAIGEGKQCTIGALTTIMFEKMGVTEDIRPNIAVETSSSGMLIPSVATKSVDAAIAYVTDTKAESDKVDTIFIDSQYAKAVQPFAIAKRSEFKYLGRRLFQSITDARARFETAGFNFRFDDGKNPLGDL